MTSGLRAAEEVALWALQPAPHINKNRKTLKEARFLRTKGTTLFTEEYVEIIS